MVQKISKITTIYTVYECYFYYKIVIIVSTLPWLLLKQLHRSILTLHSGWIGFNNPLYKVKAGNVICCTVMANTIVY